MANHIWLRGMDCAVSNGGMAVLLTALGLSGSRLAGTEEERRLIVWLMEHDQSVLGLGAVGFSLSELPWERERLAEGQDFLLRTIGGARAHLGWESLDYRPDRARLEDWLDCLEAMVTALSPEDIQDGAAAAWLAAAEPGDPVRNNFPKCPQHGIYLTAFGCLACNDA